LKAIARTDIDLRSFDMEGGREFRLEHISQSIRIREGFSFVGICALDANKLKDSPNEEAAICGLLLCCWSESKVKRIFRIRICKVFNFYSPKNLGVLVHT